MLKRICLLLLALLTLGACQQEEEKEQGSVAVANPFTTCETLTEAEKVAQFSLSIPEELRDCEGILFRAANSPSLQLLEVVFPLEQGEVLLRKAPGSEDISGVYTDFSTETEYCGSELSFTLLGDGEKDFLALWQKDGYSYSIYAEEGVDAAVLQQWVYATQ